MLGVAGNTILTGKTDSHAVAATHRTSLGRRECDQFKIQILPLAASEHLIQSTVYMMLISELLLDRVPAFLQTYSPLRTGRFNCPKRRMSISAFLSPPHVQTAE